MRKILSMLLILGLILSVAGCNNSTTSSVSDVELDRKFSDINEDYFKWDGNTIVGLTDEGVKQVVLTIPERCEGFEAFVFSGDSHVEEVYFESDKDIRLNGVFQGAKTLKRIELPAELTTIEVADFTLCYALEEIKIPAAVTAIGEYAFQYAKNLRSITFEGTNLEIIHKQAFEGCESLASIEFPNSLKTIEDYAFSKCYSLKSITFPESIQEIAHFAFVNSGVREFHFPSIVSEDLTVAPDALMANASETINVHVPKDTWLDERFYDLLIGPFNKITD